MARLSRFACGFCKSRCSTNCVHCFSCKRWFHATCQNLTSNELESWGEIDSEFMCIVCRSDENGDFNYTLGMERLQTAAKSKSIESMRKAAKRERLFNAEFPRIESSSSAGNSIDLFARDLLHRYLPVLQCNPLKTSGDGNCLFNAVSLLLQGDEKLSVALRYLSCLTLIGNEQPYKKHIEFLKLHNLSPTFSTAVFDCANIGHFSSAWTIIALCNVVSRPIKIIYPPYNGHRDFAHKHLNCTFRPTCQVEDVRELTILWCRMGCLPKKNEWYSVNHFVAVACATTITTPLKRHNTFEPEEWLQPPKCAKISSSFEEYSSSSNRNSLETDHDIDEWIKPEKVSSPFQVSTSSCSTTSCYNSFEALASENIEKTKKRPRKLPSGASSDDFSFSADEFACSSPIPQNYSSFENVFGKKPHHVARQKKPRRHSPPPPYIENSSVHSDAGSCPPILKPALTKSKFMCNNEIMKIFKTGTPSDFIPGGEKNDCFLLIKSTCSEFPDDCGVWDSRAGTTVNQNFIYELDRPLIAIYKKNSLYCTKKVVSNKTTYVELKPQPQNIISLHRYYAKLKHNYEYRKRITKLVSAPIELENLLNLAIVEYSGSNFASKPPHGNSKDTVAYIRTNPEILRKAYSMSKSEKASVVAHKMCLDDSLEAPKSARQVQDKIYRVSKKSNLSINCNLADDILAILSKQHDSTNIKEVCFSGHRQPSIILYSKEQLVDIKKNCFGENGSVLGVDRTFNLGQCFVTAFSYKNRSVLNRKTGEEPIMLGPLFLHWDGEQSTYNHFFAHVRDALGPGEWKLGCDQEKAILNSLKENFPCNTILLCTKHIKDNIKLYLQKLGTSEDNRNKIIYIIFNSKTGIVYSKSESEFLSRRDALCQYFKKDNKFKNYWNIYIENNIRKHVNLPLRENKISKLWTNNNSESINHRLKQLTDWKQHTINNLIEKLTLASEIQILNLRRALYGYGSYKLNQNASQFYKFDFDVWHSKNKREKNDVFWRFLNDKRTLPNPTKKFFFSANKKFKVVCPKTSSGKKPGQRKRIRAERTRSFKK